MLRRPRINTNMFDESVDNLSDLVQKFSRKSKRVRKIFDDDEEDEIQINEKSYGMRLVSLNKIDENIPKNHTSNDKENENETKTSQNKNHNVKALSPVAIIEAPNNQITESRSPFKVSSQQKNESLRRSLFKQPTSSQMSNTAIICSTPCTNNGLSRKQNIFFGSNNKMVENLSPIRKGLSCTILTEEDMNGIRPIDSQNNNAALDNVVPVNSLQNLEIDLREQFQIDQQTPKKTYSKSVIVEKSIRISENKNVISSSQSEAPSTVKNPYVRIEQMDISTEAILLYRKNQMRRLSTSNRTNINTFNMIETPIVHKEKQSIINDSLLAKKLAMCESDSDLTEDDSEKQKTPKRSAVRQGNKKKSMSTENNLTNDESNNDPTPVSNYKITDDMASPKKASPQNSVEDLKKRSMHNIKKKDTRITDNNERGTIESDDESKNEVVGPKSPVNNKKVFGNANKADRFYKSRSETSIECVPPESESDVSENEEIIHSKNNQDQPSNIEINQVEEIFKKPNTTRKKKKYIELTCNDLESSANSVMPPAIIQSILEFKKHSNETTTTSETGSKSLKINRPKGKTKIKGTKKNEKLEDYMALDKKLNNTKRKNKDKKEKLGKRILYSQKSYIEDEKEQQQPEPIISTQNDDNNSDIELIATVNEIRKSIDSMSDASSQGFDHPKSPEIKRGRGRPKKQNPSDSAGTSKSRSNKTRKRQNKSADEDEPPSKTNRLAVNRDDDEKSNNGDEGFQSNDDVSFDNIRYDPYKNGCKRPGLRVRRYRRPFWIGKSKVCNYGVTYGVLTKDDVKAIQYQKKHHISEQDILQRNPIDMYIAPSDRMDHLREIVAMRKKNNDAKSESGSASKRAKANRQDKNHDELRIETESVDSVETFAEAMTRMIDNYKRLPERGENSAQTYASSEFDFTQINHLNWINIGDGLLYSCFVEGGLDGFLKFDKGALKARSKTKSSVVKLTVLCGKIEIIVNSTAMTIDNLGFATIYKGQTYSIQNSKDDVAVVLINRFYESKQIN